MKDNLSFGSRRLQPASYKYLLLIIVLMLTIYSLVNAALTQVEVEDTAGFTGTWTTAKGILTSSENTCEQYNSPTYRMTTTNGDYYQVDIPSCTSISVVLKKGINSIACTITIDDQDAGTGAGWDRCEDYPYEKLLTIPGGASPPYTLKITATGAGDGRTLGIDCVKYGDFNFGSVSGKMYPPVVAAKSYYVLGGVKIGVYQGSNLITYGYTSTKAGDLGKYTIYGLNTGTYTVRTIDPKWQYSTEQTVSVAAGSTTSVPDLYAVGHRIWSPGPAKPEIRKPKETFNIEFFGSSSCGSFTATLSNTYKTYAIPIEKVSYNSTLNLHTLKATIQSNVIESLYTLTVNSSEGSDTVVRAVKVVKNYKTSFYFVHSTDTHITAGETSASNTLRKGVEQWNIIRPDLVIFTGDNVSDSRPPGFSNIELFMSIINECEVPTLVMAGNHDRESNFNGDITNDWDPTICDREMNILYNGPPYYSRDYGQYHFTAIDYEYVLNTYTPEGRSGFYLASEWGNWLKNDWSKAQGSRLRIHGMHSYYYYDTATADWSTYRINMVLRGHNHTDEYRTVGTTPTIDIQTNAGFENSYRLIRIQDNSFVSWWYNDEANKTQSITINPLFLIVNYSTVQDGSVESSKATIQNNYLERFENSQIKFVMKRGTYTATGGTVATMLHSDDKTKTVVYVNVDIAKQSTQQVSITRVGDAIDEGITAKINYKEGGTVAITGMKGEVRLDIPAYTFASDTTLTLNTEPDLPSISGQGEYKGTNVGVEITAAAEGEMKYLKAMTLTIGYRNEDIIGLDENKLSIAYYNTTEKKWFVLPSKINVDNNKVEATITHFSLFQVVEYGTPSNLDSVRVYPNPYQPSKHAQINFMGLTATSVIKIYTINGEKVNEVQADVRGNAIWDSNNSSGEKVGSGVYLGYITDGTNRKTVKICIER